MSGTGGASHKVNGNLISLSSKTQVQQQQQLHLQQQQQNQQQQSSSQQTINSSQHQPPPVHSTTVATVHQQIPGSNHQNSSNQSSSITGTGQHTIPPRYQPPPQPPGGILKHIPAQTSGYYPAELTALHLNIKYPPEIPKLASVYIPDSAKCSGNPARFNQRPPPHRLSSGGHNIPILTQNQAIHYDNHILCQQQQQQQLQQQEMLKFVRKPDNDSTTGSSQGSTTVQQSGAGRLTAEQNRHLQSLLAELRALKEANQRLSDDNQELRDLCCFLDDDRQKGRKLAREWQRFGRYTASVMRQEVSAYQNKLRQLDDKQQELIRDNLELKELCLYLDEERAHVAANTLCANCGAATRPVLRDDGDGSSSSTNADEISAIRQFERPVLLPELNMRSALSDQTLQYVRSLERRIRQLEEERIAGTTINTSQTPDPISGRPEAVVRALQVLEVREQLERDRITHTGMQEQMDDGEKALVREMCNVVWRKLEESPNGPNIDPL